MGRKELPPEHQPLKTSFEVLLQRCSQSATDLVCLNLPHDACLTPYSWFQDPLAIDQFLCDSFFTVLGRAICVLCLFHVHAGVGRGRNLSGLKSSTLVAGPSSIET